MKRYWYFVLCFISSFIFDVLPRKMFYALNDLTDNYLLAFVYGSGLDWFSKLDSGENDNEPF